MSADVTEAIRKLDREGKAFDFIFMDPPYRMDLPKKVLEALRDTSLADEETLIIVEEALDTDFPGPERSGMRLRRVRNIRRISMYS